MRVDKILSELGYPEPPIDLAQVRELLKLDRSYFTGEQEGVLAATVSRIRRSGRQLLTRPARIIDVVKKFDLRALYLPDEKKILIDDATPERKQRWLEAHEIGHDILPWHHDLLFGEDDLTPTPSAHDRIEAEANHAAGMLLFMTDSFSKDCKDLPPSLATAKQLMKRYGNTLTSTLWRMVETAGFETPILGLIGQHPKDFGNGSALFRHFIPSMSFMQKFDLPPPETIAKQIGRYCTGRRGPLGTGEIRFSDRQGTKHVFTSESFFNNYDLLTLCVYERSIRTFTIPTPLEDAPF